MTILTVYSPDAFEMACSFVRWYYPLINGCSSESSNCDMTENFGSQHFWLDASAQVKNKLARSVLKCPSE